jgi:quercetin dioxygenase-like cupin family protein
LRSRSTGLVPLLSAAAIFAAATFPAAQSFAQEAPAAPSHTMITADQIVWGAGPPGLPPGVQTAVIAGDPGQSGPFTLRARMPAGYRIAPHWHPTDEHVTVLSGTVAMGMGETFDEKALMELPPGGFAAMPPNTRHYLKAKTAAVIQVHGTGPFAVTYVNPADDPRNAAPKK